MIEEKQKDILKELDNSYEIKRFKELEKIIKNNTKYQNLIDEFELNKNEYIKKNILNEETIKLRKKLFEIDEIKEYAKLETDIRLFSKRVSDIISSVVDKEKC